MLKIYFYRYINIIKPRERERTKMNIGIKYLESVYAISKGSKLNIYAVAATSDPKVEKIGSSMYATRADIESLHNAYIKAKDKDNSLLECELSTGLCSLRKCHPQDQPEITLYSVSIGGIRSTMSARAYYDFVESIETCYNILMNKPKIFSFIKGKKKRKRKGLFD